MKMSRIWGEDLAKALIVSLVLFSLFPSLVSATKIVSTFSCTNTNAETTFYSYLKSPGLDESGYTAGLKTGTLNYYKGNYSYLRDKLTYYDGINPYQSDHNASATHILQVNFSGDPDTSKGISQFFAKGFYTNNRVVSASKKFWFNNQTSYPTNDITVDTNATINLKGSYDLKYDATAKNAYFVFSDVTGYSNKTGARRIDWEQEGLLKGEQVKLTNNLRAIIPYKPRGGGVEDWLPCTCLSIDPLNKPNLGVWPSSQAFAVLQPTNLMLLRPDCNGAIEPLVLGKVKCHQVENWRGASSLLFLDTPSDIEDLQTSTTPLVQVASSWKPNDANKAIADYTMEVENFGNIEASSAVLVIKLVNETNYVKGSATINDVTLEDPYRPYNNGSLSRC